MNNERSSSTRYRLIMTERNIDPQAVQSALNLGRPTLVQLQVILAVTRFVIMDGERAQR